MREFFERHQGLIEYAILGALIIYVVFIWRA